MNARSGEFPRSARPAPAAPPPPRRKAKPLPEAFTHPAQATYALLDLFETQIWPRFVSEPLELHIQPDLERVKAMVWWDEPRGCYKIAISPGEDLKADLETLLHELGHVVEGHVPKLAQPPRYINPVGRVIEAKIPGLDKPDPVTEERVIQPREREAERWAESMMAKLMPQ